MIGNDWAYTFPEESDDELAHFGTKGMKWGVRKQNELARETRLASGNGTLKDKTHRLLTTNTGELVRAKGSYQKVSENRKAKLESLKGKIESGKHWTQSNKVNTAVKIAQVVGGAAALAGAAYVANGRWKAGADARLFKQLQPELVRRVAGVVEINK